MKSKSNTELLNDRIKSVAEGYATAKHANDVFLRMAEASKVGRIKWIK